MRIKETGCTKELAKHSRKLDMYQQKVVGIGVKIARGIVKARNGGSRYPCPIQLMVHGGAGSRK